MPVAEDRLVEFARVLRGAGVAVSPAETLDAVRVAALVGYADRERLRAGLSLAMAKSEGDKSVFDACFDRFFSFAPAANESTSPEKPETVPGMGDMPGGGGGGSQPSSELGQLLFADSASLQARLAQAVAEADPSSIRVITQKGLFGRRVMLGMGVESLDEEILAGERAQDPQRRRLASELRRRRDGLREQVIEEINRQFLLHGRLHSEQLREQAMRSVRLDQLSEFRRVRSLVERMARRLASVHSRRRRRALRGQLDARRTLAGSIRHDAVPMDLHWKTRRRDRARVMVVCDVSRSVSAAARFLLMFLYAMNDVLPRVRSFAFASRFGEVTELFERMDSGEAVDEIMRLYGGAGTDYGFMLSQLRTLCEADIDRNTTLIFLGDARANDLPPGQEDLAALRDRARQIFWLNPESRLRWDSGDSVMSVYRPYCRAALPCANLNQLERFVDHLLRDLKN